MSLPLGDGSYFFFTSLEAAGGKGGEGSKEVIKCHRILHTGLDLDLAGGEGPSSPNTPRPYRQALCVPLKVISSLIHL
jgi:hypothetical protein